MERKGFIGGSDAVKIMQGKWNELWHVKTGRKEPEDLSRVLPVQLGILTEDFNISWFEVEWDKEIINKQVEFKKTIRGVPIKGTIDGEVAGSVALIECKHTNSMTNMDKQIEYYMPQIQLYMHLAGLGGCYMSVIFGNWKWESAYVSFDTSYFDAMMDMIAEFWQTVIDDHEPADSTPQPTKIDHIPVDQMVRRDASTDNAFINAANDYIEAQPYVKSFEAAKKSLKEMVADNEREVYSPILTIKRAKNNTLRITIPKGE